MEVGQGPNWGCSARDLCFSISYLPFLKFNCRFKEEAFHKNFKTFLLSLNKRILLLLLLVGWDLRHQVLRPLLAYCTAPDDR
jgi:hypothetical protein